MIRVDGESPERLGGLVRGYANLGLLTEFHWHPAHKAFKARSLVYAQRMVACDKQPWRAVWHRAYAFALAGPMQYALDDLQTAEKQWKAAANDGGPRPSWVELIDDYCRFAQARLKAASKKESDKDQELALLLWFDSIEHSGYQPLIVRVAAQTLQKSPTCYPVMEALSEHGGVSVGHSATSAPLVIVGKMLYEQVLAIPGLPPKAVKITKAAPEDSDADNEPSAGEFELRAKLIDALLESDGSAAKKADGAAPPADAAALDHGEPSWTCLGRLISNLSFVHVWRRTKFLAQSLGVPADDFVKAAAPLVEMHPYRQFLATYSENPTAERIAWEKMAMPEVDDLEFQEAKMWSEYQSRHMPAAADMRQKVLDQFDDTHRDFYTLETNNRERNDYPWWSAVLLRNNSYSPIGAALAIQYCGNEYKSRFGEWEKAAADHPGIAHALAIHAVNIRDLEGAEKWFKILAATGDVMALQNLASVYGGQGKMDKWVATLEASLKAPDTGLWHARARTNIARYYMRNKQWEKALPHAKGAAGAYSAGGLQVLADCYEGMHDWKAAEQIYTAMGKRYPITAMAWYSFCLRTGQGDLAAARQAAVELTGPTRVAATNSALPYYLYEKDSAKEHHVLQFMVRDGNPIYDLHSAVLADQEHDAPARDKALDRVKQTAAHFRRLNSQQNYACLAALAGLFADDLAKGGKGEIDLDAAEKLNPPQPFEEDSLENERSRPAIAFNFLLGRYFNQHGKPDLAVRCWRRCLADTEYMSDFHRTLVAAELLARKIPLESEEKDAEKPKSQP